MRIFIDFEFLEDGRTIDPISVGMVAEDGREYYGIVADGETFDRAINHDWLRANVMSSLPVRVGEPRPTLTATAIRRMREARERLGWSARRLGEEMAKAGVPWNREIVANLEGGRRAMLTVEEWLALGWVLDTNPFKLVDMEPDSPTRPPAAYSWEVDTGHPDFMHMKGREQIRDEVRDFIQATPDVQLWGWYSAYDHVCLAQLFGRMIDLPNGVPMFTCDLKQEAVRLGVSEGELPKQESGVHNALADARHNKRIAEYLDGVAQAGGRSSV